MTAEFLPPDPGARSFPDLAPSAVGGFDIEALLGEGGKGRVFRARQRSLDRAVALKLLDDGPAMSSNDRERFVREAQSAARVDHPNVVKVIDAGVDPGSVQPFIAFELVEGEDLGEVVARNGPISESRALDIGQAICRGLDAISRAGLIHRDVKPENVLLTDEGDVKLGDLGLAKSADGDAASITRAGEIVGTPHYMSPEQARGLPLDIRSDLYALGLVLYHATTGALPFPGRFAIETLTRRQNEDCPDPRALVPDLSSEIADLIARLAARDPDGRPATPGAALALFGAVAGGRSLDDAVDPPVVAARPPSGDDAPAARPRRVSSRRHPPRSQPRPTVREITLPDGVRKRPGSVAPVAIGASLVSAAVTAAVLFAFLPERSGPEASGTEGAIAGASPDAIPAEDMPPLTAATGGTPDPGDDDDDDTTEPAIPGSTPDEPPPTRPPPGPTATGGPSETPPGAIPRGPTREELGDDPRVWSPILETRAARLARVWGRHAFKHSSMGNVVSVSRDGRRVVSLSIDGLAAVSDLVTGAELRRIAVPRTNPRRAVRSAAIAPDGRFALIGDDQGRLHAFAAEASSAAPPVASRPVHADLVVDIRIPGDGRRIVSAARDGTVIITAFDPATGRFGGEERRIETKPPGRPCTLSVSGDGHRLLVGFDPSPPEKPRVEIYDLAQRPSVLLHTLALEAGAGAPQGVLDPTGHRALVSVNQATQHAGMKPVLWTMPPRGKTAVQLDGGHRGVRAIAFSEDGKRALTGGFHDGVLVLWELEPELRILHRMSGHEAGWVQDAAFIGSDRAVSIGNDSVVRRWDLVSGAEIDPPPPSHIGGAMAVAAARAGPTVATIGWDGVRIWNGRTRAARLRIRERMQVVAVSPSGVGLAGGTGAGHVAFRDLRGAPAGQGPWTWVARAPAAEGQAPSPTSAIAATEDQVVSGHADGTVYTWAGNPPSGMRLAEESGAVIRVEVLPTGLILAVTADGKVGLWEANVGTGGGTRRVQMALPPGQAPFDAAVTADGTRLAIVTATTLHVISLPDGGGILAAQGNFDRMPRPRLAWAPDGRRLLIGNGRTITILDIDPGAARAVDEWNLPAPGRYEITGVAFADDGRSFYVTTQHGSTLIFELK